MKNTRRSGERPGLRRATAAWITTLALALLPTLGAAAQPADGEPAPAVVSGAPAPNAAAPEPTIAVPSISVRPTAADQGATTSLSTRSIAADPMPAVGGTPAPVSPSDTPAPPNDTPAPPNDTPAPSPDPSAVEARDPLPTVELLDEVGQPVPGLAMVDVTVCGQAAGNAPIVCVTTSTSIEQTNGTVGDSSPIPFDRSSYNRLSVDVTLVEAPSGWAVVTGWAGADWNPGRGWTPTSLILTFARTYGGPTVPAVTATPTAPTTRPTTPAAAPTLTPVTLTPVATTPVATRVSPVRGAAARVAAVRVEPTPTGAPSPTASAPTTAPPLAPTTPDAIKPTSERTSIGTNRQPATVPRAPVDPRTPTITEVVLERVAASPLTPVIGGGALIAGLLLAFAPPVRRR